MLITEDTSLDNPARLFIEQTAVKIIARWENSRHTLDFLLGQVLQETTLSASERATLTERIFSWGRGRGTARYLLNRTLTKGLDSIPPDLRRQLELAVCRLLFEEKTPTPVIVSTAVEHIKGAFGMSLARVANAVLRDLSRSTSKWFDPEENPAEYLTHKTSHPRWIVERWLDRWGEECTRAQLEWDNRRPDIWLRWNRLKGDLEIAEHTLQDAGIAAETSADFDGFFKLTSSFYPGAAELIQKGDFSVQDPSGSLSVRLLDPKPRMKILDLCAAPGGKATLISQLCGDRCNVVAVDISESRLRQIKAALQTLGIRNITTIAADGRKFCLHHQGVFDAVLVDAPCSGFGVLNRRADLRWRRQPEDIPELTQLQKELMRAGSLSVRSGGTLVYSTCSIEPEENEAIVQDFLATIPDFQCGAPPTDFPARFLNSTGAVNTYSPRDGIDGVYAARLIKK